MITSKEIRLTEHVARIAAMRNGYRILVAKHEDKEPVARPISYVDVKIIIKWVLEKYSVSEYAVAQDRAQWRALVNTVMNLCVP
jgi:hypothetical protein